MTAPARTVTTQPQRAGSGRTPSDEALTATARDLVEVLAPALGLSPDSVRVHTGQSGRRARAFGASGLTDGAAIYLAPEAFDGTAAGRALLAHELTHVAQQRSQGRGRLQPGRDAEAEARELALAAAQGRPLWRPVALLPPGARAADNGAVGTLTRPAPTTAGTAAPAHEHGDEPDAGKLDTELGKIVERKYRAARTYLTGRLGGLFVTGGDVRDALRLLDTMPFLLGRALIRSLESPRPANLARHLDNDHHRAYPGPALAGLSALPSGLLRAVEAPNVEGMDPTGLGVVARRAAGYVMVNLRSSVQLLLLHGNRASFFGGILKGPLPPGTDAKALKELVDQETADDAAEQTVLKDPVVKKKLDEVRRLLAHPDGEDAVAALTKLAELALTPPPPPAAVAALADASGPPDSPPPAPEKLRPDPPVPGPRLLFAVHALDREGLMDRLLHALPASERRADGVHAGKLLVVLAAREPYRTLLMVESLLSYTAFLDWVITDAEARFAYVLIRSLPISMQERWRRWDEGKWFARLEENIPTKDTLTGLYAGVGSGADPFDPALRKELLRDVTAVVRKIDRACQGGISALRAVDLIRMVLMLGQPETSKGKHKPGAALQARRIMLTTAVRRLDALGHLDRILEALPDTYLMHEEWRGELLEIFAARDPRHIERHARKLLTWGILELDLAVTAREALLAANLVRNLPAADQDRLKAEDPDRWAKMQAEMTPEMRASLANTNIGGRVAVETRDRLRDRLRDNRVWHYNRRMELRSLLIQLYAVDDRHWAFRRSYEVKAWKITGLEQLVRELHLYDPVNNPRFTPEQLHSTTVWQEGPFQVLGDIGRWIAVGLEMLWLALPSLFTRTVRVKGANVAHFQWAMGGDLAGARLLDDEEVRKEDEERKKSGQPEPNRLDLSVTPYAGYLALKLPRLELSGLSRSWAGGSLHTGRVSITGLDVVAHFSDPHYETPVGAEAKFGSAKVDDAVLAMEGLPGGLVGVAHLDLDQLKLTSGGKGTEDLSEREKNGWVGVPVIGPLLQALSNIIYLYGGLPGLSNISDMALAPMTAGAPYLARKFASFTAGEIFSPLANSAIGLISDGVFRPPRNVVDRMGDAAAMLHALSVSFDGVTVEGLSFAGLEQVARVEIGKTVLGLGRSLPTQLRAEQASLKLRLNRTGTPAGEQERLQNRLKDVEKELHGLEKAEDELDRLEARHRHHDTALSDTERKRMVELSEKLRRVGGGALDIEGIRVIGLSGVVETAGLEIGPIHAETATPSRWGEYLPDEELIKRFRTEVPPRDAKEALKGTKAEATIGDIRVLPGPTGEPALRLNIGRPPTADEARALLDKLPKEPRFAQRREMLTWWTKAPSSHWPAPLDRLWALESMDAEHTGFLGARTPNPRGSAREQELQLLREKANHDFGLSVGGLKIRGLGVRLDPDTLNATLDLAELEATNIRYGAYTVKRVAGEHLGTGIPPEVSEEGGTVLSDLVPGVAQVRVVGVESPAALRAGKLTVEGAEGPGLSVQKVTVNGLRGTVGWSGNDIRIPNLVVDSAEVQGVSYSSPGRTVFATGTTTIGKINADIAVATIPDAEGNRVLDQITVRSLRIARIDADRVGMDVTAPEPGYRVEAESGALVGLWVKDLTLGMTGKETLIRGNLGVEQLDKLRFDVITRAMQGDPTTVKGTLGSAAVTAGGPVSAVSINLDYFVKDNQRIDLTRVDLHKVALTEGELGIGKNKIKIERADISGAVTTKSTGEVYLDKLRSEKIIVNSIDWHTTDGGKITARGATVLSGVEVSGRWESESDRKIEEEQGTRIEPGHKLLKLDHLHVDQITSDNLQYVDGDVELHLGRFGRRRPDLLDIHNVNVDGLKWEQQRGAARGEISEGTVTTGKSSVEVGGRLQAEKVKKDKLRHSMKVVQEALFVQASVSAQKISLSFGENGRITTRAQGVGGDIGLGNTKEAAEQHLSFSGLDTGLIDVQKDHIDIGPEGTPGLHIDNVTVDGLNWKGDPLSLSLPEDWGYLSFSGINVRARIELNPPGHPQGRLRKLLLRKMEITQTRGKGLIVKLAGGAAFWLDTKDEELELGKLELKPPQGEEGFVIERGQTSKGMEVRGMLDLAGFQLPWVAADIAKHVEGHADVGASRVTCEFFGAAGLKLDLHDPSILNVEAKLEHDSRRRLFMILPFGFTGPAAGGVRSKVFTYEQKTGPRGEKLSMVTVKGTEIQGLTYADARFGLRVFVRKAVAPSIIHNISSGIGELSTLDIQDAQFTIDLGRLLSGGSSSGRSFATATALLTNWQDLIKGLAPYGDIMNSINGVLDFDVISKGDRYPIRATFVDGSLNYERLGKALFTAVPYARPYFVMDKDTLVLRVELRDWLKVLVGPLIGSVELDALRWNLPSGEAKVARRDHLIRIMQLIEPSLASRTRLADILESAGLLGGPAGDLSIANIKAKDLSIKNPKEAFLPLGGANYVVLAPNALIGLNAAGALGGETAAGVPQPGKLEAISLGSATIARSQLVFDSLTGRTTVHTGKLEVLGLSDCSLTFSGFTPRVLTGRITRATASDIGWKLPGGAP